MKQMGMIEYIQILSHWEIGFIHRLISVMEGNPNGALLAETEKGAYILRQVDTEDKAKLEHEISVKLYEKNLAPEILMAYDGKPYAKFGEKYYNLQNKLDSEKIKTCSMSDVMQIARLFVSMERELKKITIEHDFEDMNALKKTVSERTLARLRESYEGEQVISHLEELKPYDEDKTQLIHGECCIRNMLRTKEGIVAIDFSDARLGSPYLDMAGMISSILETVTKVEERPAYLRMFLQTVLSEKPDLNLSLVERYILLYHTRKVFSVLKYQRGDDEAFNEAIHDFMYYCSLFNK